MEKEIIGYKLIKPEYKEAALKIVTATSFNTKKCLNYCFAKDSVSYNELYKAGVLDLWFEPVYEQKETVYRMGTKEDGFDLIVKDGKVFHNKTEDITEAVKDLQEHFKNFKHTNMFGKFEFRLSPLKFLVTGCRSIESTLQQWLNIKL